MPILLSKFLPKILILIIVLAAAGSIYALGYNKAELHHQEQLNEALQKAAIEQKRQFERGREAERKLANTQAAAVARSETIHEEIDRTFETENDCPCLVSGAAVGLLNAARDTELPLPAARPVEKDTPSSAISLQALVHDSAAIAHGYELARTQCNTLIEWIETEYDSQDH